MPNPPRAPLALLPAIALAAAGAGAVDLQVALRTPRLERLVASVPVDGAAPVAVDVALRFDEKGRLVCGGECRVDGAPVDVKGRVLSRSGAASYKLVLKGRTGKLQLKVAGDPAAAIADFAYRGPKGRAGGAHPVAIDASAAVATISVHPHVDAKGKLTGSGVVSSGFGNDPAAPGVLAGRRQGDALRWKLRAGGRTVGFAGTLVGDDFVGTLKLKVPPEKGTFEAHAVPGALAELPGPNAGTIVLSPYRPDDVVPDPTGGPGEIVSGRILVDFEDQVDLATIDARLAAHALSRIGLVGAINLVTAEILDGSTELEAQAAIESEPEVESAPLAYVFEAAAAAAERLPGQVPADEVPEVQRDLTLALLWPHYLMDTFAAHGLAEAIRGSRVSDVELAVVDTGFHRQPGAERGDREESLLVDPLHFDVGSKVVVPIASVLTPVGGVIPMRPDVVAGEIDAASNPLLYLPDWMVTDEGGVAVFPDTHGLGVSALAVGAGRDLLLGTGRHVKLIPVRWQAWVPGDEIGVTGPNHESIPVTLKSADYAAAALSFLAEVPNPDLRVINLSWGGLVTSAAQADRVGDVILDALRAHERQGRLVVAAVGNDDGDADAFHPASLSVARNPLGGGGGGERLASLMAVAGTAFPSTELVEPEDDVGELLQAIGLRPVFEGWRERRYFRSNSGDVVSVSAPAQGVPALSWLSTPPYFWIDNGTSYAAPLVAGLAAEMFAVDPSLRPTEAIDILQRTADDLVGAEGAPGWDPAFGHGRVNAWKALLTLVNRRDPERPRWLGIRLRSTLPEVEPVRVSLAGAAVEDTVRKRVPELAPAAGDNARAVPFPTTGPTATATLFSFEAADLDPARATPGGALALLEVAGADGAPSYQLPLRLRDVLEARPVEASGLDDFVLTLELRSRDHGALYGRVTDGGAGVADATIRYAASAGGQGLTTTDADGWYTAYDARADGPFEVSAQKGDAEATAPGVQVAPLRAVQVDFELGQPPPPGSFEIEAYTTRTGAFDSSQNPGFDPSRADIQLSGPASAPVITWGSDTPEGPKPGVSKLSVELQPSRLEVWGIQDVAWGPGLPPGYDANVIASPVSYGDFSVPGTSPFPGVSQPSPPLVPGQLYQVRILWISSPGFTRSAWLNFRVQ